MGLLSRIKTWGLKKSIWVFHVNSGACNNCDIEIVDLLTPRFDVERFGIRLVGSPEHADALLITGIVTRQVKSKVQEVYRLAPKPCIVFAIGACACSKGIFKRAYHAAGPVDKVIKEVDPDAKIVYIPGCPPKPEAMILGVVKALETL